MYQCVSVCGCLCVDVWLRVDVCGDAWGGGVLLGFTSEVLCHTPCHTHRTLVLCMCLSLVLYMCLSSCSLLFISSTSLAPPHRHPQPIDMVLYNSYDKHESLASTHTTGKFIPFNPTDKYTVAYVTEVATKKQFMLMKGAPQVCGCVGRSGGGRGICVEAYVCVYVHICGWVDG